MERELEARSSDTMDDCSRRDMLPFCLRRRQPIIAARLKEVSRQKGSRTRAAWLFCLPIATAVDCKPRWLILAPRIPDR